MGVLKSRPLVAFYILAILIALSAMAIRAADPAALGAALRQIFARNEVANIVTAIQYSLETPVLWNAILFPAAPTIAAFLVIALVYGPKGLARWGARLAPWRGMSWRRGLSVWLLVVVAFLAMVGVYLIVLHVHDMDGEIESTIARYGSSVGAVLAMLSASLLLSSGPLLEEMGWRGFALPLLLSRFNALTAAIVLGVLWAMWHMPRDIIPLIQSGDWDAFLTKQVNVVVGTVALTIIITFLYMKLGGSVWGGVLGHALHNEFVVNVMRVQEPVIMLGGFPLRGSIPIELSLALLILLLNGPNLGAERDWRKEPHPFAG